MTKTTTEKNFGLTCRCGTSLSYAQERWINYSSRHSVSCAACGRQYKAADVSRMPLKIKDTCRVFLGTTGKQEALSRTWFHATASDNWLGDIQSLTDESMPVVHLGTLDAAYDRARSLAKRHPGKKLYLYTVRIENAECTDSVLPDDDSIFPTYVTELQHFGLQGVTRYLNRYECSGSISLIADPRLLIVGARAELN